MGKNKIVQKIITVAVITVSVLITGCNRNNTEESNIIEISERMFLTHVRDIYMNPLNYLGRTIRLEGIFRREEFRGTEMFFVVRRIPGCHIPEEDFGFEVKWPEDRRSSYPPNDAWVETIGELKYYVADNRQRFLYLELVSLRVLERRGQELVTR